MLRWIYWRRSFFFQAEDGIRDWSVTGVQTCALPISALLRDRGAADRRPQHPRLPRRPARHSDRGAGGRSEERRVGKECRSRWRTGHYTKKRTETDKRPRVKALVEWRTNAHGERTVDR